MSNPSPPKHTGLMCQACRQPVALIEYQTPNTLTRFNARTGSFDDE